MLPPCLAIMMEMDSRNHLCIAGLIFAEFETLDLRKILQMSASDIHSLINILLKINGKSNEIKKN